MTQKWAFLTPKLNLRSKFIQSHTPHGNSKTSGYLVRCNRKLRNMSGKSWRMGCSNSRKDRTEVATFWLRKRTENTDSPTTSNHSIKSPFTTLECLHQSTNFPKILLDISLSHLWITTLAITKYRLIKIPVISLLFSPTLD